MLSVLSAILIPFFAAYGIFHGPQGSSALPVLTSFIVVPIISAFVILALPERFTRWVSLVFASFELGIGVSLFFSFQNALAGFQFVESVPWLKNLGITYLLGVDGMSTLMVLLVACVYFAGSLISWNISLRKKEYFIFFSLLVGGVAGAYESLDLFFFFLFYEFAVLPMYLLVGIWGTGRREYAAMKLTVYLLAGSAFMLVGFLAIYFASNVHTFDIRALSDLSQTALSPSFQNIW